MVKIIIISILMFFAAYFPLINIASAQSVDLGIYPPVFEIQTTPPSSIKVPFFVQNFSDAPVKLYISLAPFSPGTNENGQIQFEDNTALADPLMPSRILVQDNGNSISTIVLSPKQKKNLNLQITIPADEQKGEYYFSLVFSSAPNAISNANFSQASAGISSNILLSVGPSGKTQGIIADFSSPHFITQGPLPFTVRIKNTSDHYITPKGNILITNMFGQAVGKVNLLPVNILLNSTRRIPDSLQSVTASEKEYEKIRSAVEANEFPVAVWPEKFLLGPYKATLTIALSDSGPQFKKQIIFFALPAEYMLGILIIFTIVVFIAIRIRRAIRLEAKKR